MRHNLPIKPVKGLYPVFQTIFLLLLSLGASGQTAQTFTTSGSWTVPCGVTSVTIGLWGGGGAGGGSSINNSGGSGGGGGAYVVNTFAVSSGQVISYTIGAGGIGTNGNGASGTSSTLSGPFGAMSAGFGTGGGANQGAAGLGGTTGSGGTITNGSNGNPGSSAGANGGAGGNGGSGGLGSINAPGQDGTIPGAGGGGGERTGSASKGGNGASGQVSFSYTVVMPTVNAGSSQSVCAGGIVNLSGSLTGSFTSATWSGGTGTFSDVNSLSSTYTPAISSGSETLTLTAADPDGAGPCTSAFATVQITVNSNASIGSVTGSSPLCSGSSSQYFANGVVLSGGTGSWSSSDPSVATVNSSGLVTTISAGTTNIIYTISGGCGGTTAAQQELTVVLPPSVGSVTGNSPLCIGQSTVFDTNAVVLNGGSPSWSSSNPAVATVNSSGLVTGISSGTCNIIFTITGTGCSASAQQLLTIQANSNAGTVSGISTMCVGTSTTYSVSSVVYSGGTGSWSSSNPTVATVDASTGIVNTLSSGSTNIIYTVSGGCGGPVSSQQTLTVNPVPVIASVTGTSPLCISQSTTYTANSVVLNGGTPAWSSSNPAVATVNSSGVVTGISAGTCSIIYTITGSNCSVSEQQDVTVLPNANVGTISGTNPMCTNSSATYAANSAIYSGGTGSWSSTNPAVATINSSTGLVTAISPGTTTIIYTINGGCGGTVSNSRILTVNAPTNPNAGPNQTLLMCETSANLNAIAAPVPGTGTWTISPGGPTFSPNNTTPNATVNNLVLGVDYTLTWSVTNTGCGPTSDQMVIETIAPLADAGPNQSACQSTFTLNASDPEPGFTGLWTCTGCNGTNGITITDPSSPTTTVNNFDSGESVTFTWTVSGSCSFSDEVQISYAAVCNDDVCGALPITVNNGSCLYSSQNNVGATVSEGMVEPGCGNFSATTSKDVWFTTTVPANGVLTVQTVDAFGGGIMYPAIAFYNGTCESLSHAGCSSATGTTVNTYTGTPGETIYIRIWDRNGLEGSFNLCAFTHTNVMGNIVTGNTSINCGSTATFTDPGGNGNYLNNQSSFYEICPSEPGTFVSVNFSNFNLGAGDNLVIFDGSKSDDPIIGQFSGGSNPGIITSSNADGCLSFAFHSDNATVSSGWNASVTCSPTTGTNSYVCSSTNCAGNCGEWLCGSGSYPTENAGTSGVNDLSNQTYGCFNGGEISTKWFYFQAETTGFLEFIFDGPPGQTYNFAIWGPTVDFTAPCPTEGKSPIRCSVSSAQNPVGMGNGATDYYEEANGDGWVAPLDVIAGETYAMLLNIYQNGNPQPVIDLTLEGTGALDCTPSFLPITLLSFGGNNDGAANELYWVTSSENNNDYFTLERSVNGLSWEVVTTIAGAGNSSEALYYYSRDQNPYLPITYYRLKQTDFDGQSTISDVIAINAHSVMDGDFISSVFPNPSSEYATFVFNGKDTETPLYVQLINKMGQVVSEYSYTSLYSEMPATIPTLDLAEGFYQLVFTQGDEQQVQKLAIIH